jgi:hypothetical protein
MRRLCYNAAMEVTKQSADDFLSSLADAGQRKDSQMLMQLMRTATGVEPQMWGSIVGFGTVHYKYESGREGDTIVVGFAPRKGKIAVYGVVFYDQNREKMQKLGKVTVGKGCLYLKRLADVDTTLLKQMVAEAYQAKISTA